MRRLASVVSILALTGVALAGFKVKLIKPKKPDQFQAHASAGNVTYGADLLLDGKDQKDYFYKELGPSRLIAVRLAVFNASKEEVVLPLGELQLLGPDGKELPLVAPDAVAQAVLQGMVVTTNVKRGAPVSVGSGRDPRLDPNDPRYDPNDPRARDPRYDPTDPRSRDPRYDPNDPRNRDPRYDPTYPGGGGPGGYPGGGYPGGRGMGGYGGPGIILSPGGGGSSGDLTQFERSLVEKDFRDKAHAPEPILGSLNRDRFLYFSLPADAASGRGYTLRIPKSKGISEEIVLKF
jgi:hypothetical protein